MLSGVGLVEAAIFAIALSIVLHKLIFKPRHNQVKEKLSQLETALANAQSRAEKFERLLANHINDESLLKIEDEDVKTRISQVRRRDELRQIQQKVGLETYSSLEGYSDEIEAKAKRKLYAKVADALQLIDVELDVARQKTTCKFGEEIRAEHFTLGNWEDNVFLNNGSYGATPRAIIALRQEWERVLQLNPVKFKFIDLPIRWNEAIAHLSTYVRADPNWLVFVNNVNEGVSAVLRSLVIEPGDILLYNNLEYPANIALIKHLALQSGAQAICMDISLPFDEKKYLTDLEALLTKFETAPRFGGAAATATVTGSGAAGAGAAVAAVASSSPSSQSSSSGHGGASAVSSTTSKTPKSPEVAGAKVSNPTTAVKGNAIKLCIVDHITSSTALVMPVEKVIQLCHKHGVPVLIDGAHAPGQVPVDIARFNAEYYVGTLHKWSFGPPGCAFLSVRPDVQPGIYPLAVGHDLDGGYEHTFAYTGHRDYGVFLVVPEMIKFINSVCGGSDKVMQRNHDMVWRMAQKISKAWNSEIVNDKAHTGAMALVTLPFDIRQGEGSIKAGVLGGYLLKHFRITVPIFSADIRGEEKLVVRVSCHIFNVEDEYDRLIDAIKQVQSDLKQFVSVAKVTKSAIETFHNIHRVMLE